VVWGIDLRAALTGYLFSWAENQVAAAMKIMRFGHVGAQRILAALAARMPTLVEESCARDHAQISNFAPGLALASSLHETQFSRLFRS
jgi:urease accessory protein